ncbi:MAG: class I SAM-dependent methyltransferase [Chlamydiae bacterium]|nr:class I SAM-dependent methyltransferase [Chlamydiota bacterium]MBI3266508.1 class I SAM-dependent methyltransferase [Chlamydiota bacterium]
MDRKKIKTDAKKYLLKKCRICASDRLYTFVSLGAMPIPNGFLSKEELGKKEPYYPLETCVCESCWLVQLSHVIPPELMFKNYLYIPSTSITMLDHFRNMAEEAIQSYRLKPGDRVMDIGSNDGSLLSFFKEQEMKVFGIDPASNLAQLARLKGIDTLDDFFTEELAKRVVPEKGHAKVITATNVVAHVNNLHDLCEGVRLLLDKEGVFICEFPYLPDLISKNEFDTIYHEHLSYFSIQPLITLFKKHNLHIINIKKTSVHGGSIRIHVAPQNSSHQPTNRVQEFIREEALRKINSRSLYEDFGRRVKVIKRDLINYLKKLKNQGKKIVGYGASAKGNVLLNYCNIGTNLIEYIVDSIPYKQGRYTPGTHIPIHAENKLEKDMPDYALLMAWNFAEEILRKQVKYREKGGQFIITIPYLRVE